MSRRSGRRGSKVIARARRASSNEIGSPASLQSWQRSDAVRCRGVAIFSPQARQKNSSNLNIDRQLRLGSAGAKLETPRRSMRKRVVEDVQWSLVFFENELEVVPVRGIGHCDGEEIRRSAPEQSDGDSVALARRKLRPPGFVCRFDCHREAPFISIGGRS